MMKTILINGTETTAWDSSSNLGEATNIDGPDVAPGVKSRHKEIKLLCEDVVIIIDMNFFLNDSEAEMSAKYGLDTMTAPSEMISIDCDLLQKEPWPGTVSFERLPEQSAMIRTEEPTSREKEYIQKEIDHSRLPDADAFDQVQEWAQNDAEHIKTGQGLKCFGETGTAKTRAIYKLIGTRYINKGMSFKAISALDFADQVRSLSLKPYEEEETNPFLRSTQSEPQTLEEFMKRLKRTSILFIDDLHHAKFTPRYAQELFRLIDSRVTNHKPMFITTQVSGERLFKKLAGDNSDYRETAEAIIRRIRDFCTPIEFAS